MERAPRVLLLIALQQNLGVMQQQVATRCTMTNSKMFALAVAIAFGQACHRVPLNAATAALACPAPDSAGMSRRLVRRFVAMGRDSSGRAFLSSQGIASERLTAPTEVRSASDPALCVRLAARFGTPVTDAPEGGAYFRSGPYILYAPWRDYSRRAEWKTKGSEFVGFLVFDADLKVLTALAM